MVDTSISSTGQPVPKSLFGYDVIELIGQGAGSIIYAVTDPRSSQIYALKHVVRKTDKDIRFIEQLESEFEIGKQFTHPGLRKSIDLKINRTLLRKVVDAALVMELFDGTPMDVLLPPTLADVVLCLAQTGAALDALHHMGYVHCDLKPNNILVNSTMQVKVIDFGQACKIGTVKERIQGTPDFIAPEQVKCEPVTVRTDVFNFGATMYWALSGKKIPTLYTVKKGDNSFLLDVGIPTPMEINPAVPETLSNLTMDCVRTAAAKRPGNMTELVRRLETIEYGLRQRQASGKAAARV